MLPYNIIQASGQAPILISVPHCGVTFPDELKDQYKSDLIKAPDDTDWFVDLLYDFAPEMGISMITAVYSRWVIDLNRDPESKPLYTDGRIITALCPATTFLGEPLYEDHRKEVTGDDVTYRLKNYYWPYHKQIDVQLKNIKSQHKSVLLWDCHSIRQVVPTIQKEKFPDLILGSSDEKSAAAELIHTALKSLRGNSYEVAHNHPFKGGFITRHFGKPEHEQHALQLEMAKINYMDGSEIKYNKVKAGKIREMLKVTLAALVDQLVS